MPQQADRGLCTTSAAAAVAITARRRVPQPAQAEHNHGAEVAAAHRQPKGITNAAG